jgi:hypothetical protein
MRGRQKDEFGVTHPCSSVMKKQQQDYLTQVADEFEKKLQQELN